MKFLISLLLLFSIKQIGSAQQMAPDSLYIVTYSTGPGWDKAKAPNDQPYFKEHSAHLAQLRKEGIIKMGARYGEKGMIVIKATTLRTAREIIENDQAIKSQLFLAEVQKFNVFYDGCMERPK